MNICQKYNIYFKTCKNAKIEKYCSSIEEENLNTITGAGELTSMKCKTQTGKRSGTNIQ